MQAGESAAPYCKYSGCSLRLPSSPRLGIAPGAGETPALRQRPSTTTASQPRGLLRAFGVRAAWGRVAVLALFHFHPERSQRADAGSEALPEAVAERDPRVIPPALTRMLGIGNTEHDTSSRGEFPYRAYVRAGEAPWPRHAIRPVNENRSHRIGAASTRHLCWHPHHPARGFCCPHRTASHPPTPAGAAGFRGRVGNQGRNIFIFLSKSHRRIGVNEKGRSLGPSTPGCFRLRQQQVRVARGQDGRAGLRPRR